MRRDETVIVLGEDVGKKGGVFLATDGLWAEFGDDRVIDTPLTESMIVGASIGAAVNGLRPVAEIQFADFIFPAFNQIVSEAARMRYRSNNGYGVPMTIRAPYGGGVHGALYHSQSVEAFFTHVPGAEGGRAVHPVRRARACCARRSATRTRSSSSSTRRCTARSAATSPTPTTPSRSGKAKVTHPGSQVTVVAYGLMAHYALEAADRVAEDGISAEVVDLRTLRPLDTRDAARLGPQDRQVPGRLRGQQVRRLRRGGRRDRRRGGVRLPRRAGDADRRPRGPGRALQPRPRGLVHGQPGEDRRRHPEARRVLGGLRLRLGRVGRPPVGVGLRVGAGVPGVEHPLDLRRQPERAGLHVATEPPRSVAVSVAGRPEAPSGAQPDSHIARRCAAPLATITAAGMSSRSASWGLRPVFRSVMSSSDARSDLFAGRSPAFASTVVRTCGAGMDAPGRIRWASYRLPQSAGWEGSALTSAGRSTVRGRSDR